MVILHFLEPKLQSLKLLAFELVERPENIELGGDKSLKLGAYKVNLGLQRVD